MILGMNVKGRCAMIKSENDAEEHQACHVLFAEIGPIEYNNVVLTAGLGAQECRFIKLIHSTFLGDTNKHNW